MSKRGPIRQMDHSNWDQEDEPEDAGVFNTATQETMQKRVIKKAKRHIQPASEVVAGAFSAFSGFSSANNNSSFQLSKSPAKSVPTISFPKFSMTGSKPESVNGTSSATSMVVSGKSDEEVLMRSSSSSTTVSSVSVTPSTSGSSTTSAGQTSGRNSDYYRKLKTLNTNVESWITLHVNKNPCCILTPIFRDYECYLEQLEKEYPSVDSVSRDAKTGSNLLSVPLDTSSPVKNSIPLYFKDKDTSNMLPPTSNALKTTTGHKFSFGLGKGDADEKKSSSQKGSCVKEEKTTFGSSTKEDTTKANSLFGLQLTSTTNSPMNFKFGFGTSNLSSQFGSKPATSTSGFSFAVESTLSKPSNDTAEGGEEEYVPPQAQGNEIVEEDAFYTKRCKLFYKKEDAFADRGVGILYLKKVDEKTQLLIRADNSIGTILLNIMLNSSISMQKTGKNNILFCCVPFPPINPKIKSDQPVMMMIRVKTEEDTNELLAKLQPTAAKA